MKTQKKPSKQNRASKSPRKVKEVSGGGFLSKCFHDPSTKQNVVNVKSNTTNALALSLSELVEYRDQITDILNTWTKMEAEINKNLAVYETKTHPKKEEYIQKAKLLRRRIVLGKQKCVDLISGVNLLIKNKQTGAGIAFSCFDLDNCEKNLDRFEKKLDAIDKALENVQACPRLPSHRVQTEENALLAELQSQSRPARSPRNISDQELADLSAQVDRQMPNSSPRSNLGFSNLFSRNQELNAQAQEELDKLQKGSSRNGKGSGSGRGNGNGKKKRPASKSKSSK